jgi:large subunit ribosomal protein L5
MSRYKQLYDEEIRSKLKEELKLPNIMAVPRITKITLNMGVGEAVIDKKQLDSAIADMQAISGQRPIATNRESPLRGSRFGTKWR